MELLLDDSGVPVPEVIGVAAAEQFAISRERVLKRPLEFYVRVRQWLLDIRWADATSKRGFGASLACFLSG